ncbi:MAG: hypothetical protein CVU55_05975 [Deltaproteobacteria bacterium HGW-Deltaproteobacteria-13]|jgi:hypothetical protein|nr:MAG: hypothetical protein CVU55_05975 [Deltaproteobacteria bacterium HGW-Deltaproteobacteria-13]
MRKYSWEWKQKQRKWVEKHTRMNGESYWTIHYIQNDIEYSNGEYFTEKSAEEDLKNYNI